ncbi:Uncharacterised protein (plasmid) [Tsukamurella tyrosinosolvens]|uniref:Uncharacterized protein n=1 Tax=Tsukamurella tyrosinosolvens TaxID=57704 RepID=A0A1H4VQ24_TSUTY|nr:hypothetical protein [Tsukamurella tyrosinosolvens]KXO90914.1 hypothetical protein AXK58_21000 [Tsukamurella tyrosinosolvens]SEC83219.1 hypothetical protein SAMN04489793_3302 [Tsukamurella tyrosinosolvens]VEH90368.1 Uncharacterised protein [Tsukamurella tyrosinosolvens]
MTNATHTVRTVTEHRFIVPCPWPEGGDWKDFGIALKWAQDVAKEHGISTSMDDWSRLRVEDDQLVIVLTIQGQDQEP